jgi:hypothetical protein
MVNAMIPDQEADIVNVINRLLEQRVKDASLDTMAQLAKVSSCHVLEEHSLYRRGDGCETH